MILQIEANLFIKIPIVDTNQCLDEQNSPCKDETDKSCQLELRPNTAAPLVVKSETSTVVGVHVNETHYCRCGRLDPDPEECPHESENFCLNGGVCEKINGSLTCLCPDSTNYGPRCELITARMEDGYSWFSPLMACDSPNLTVTFQTESESGLILYNGPIVRRPMFSSLSLYPKDYLYIILDNWFIKVFIDLGSGTTELKVPLIGEFSRVYTLHLTWDHNTLVLEVPNCGINSTIDDEPCKKSTNLVSSLTSRRSYILNVGGPLQLGGISSMASFAELSESYNWNFVPPTVDRYFYGCFSKVQYNDIIYDMNSTDYYKSFGKTCDAAIKKPIVRLGSDSIVIIVVCLLVLIGKYHYSIILIFLSNKFLLL